MSEATNVQTSPAPPAPPPDRPNWAVLAVVLAPIFIITLDMFIVNVAIPSIQTDLHAGSAPIQFIIAGISLGVAAVLITAGRLGDLYGRRRMFLLGLALFTLASAGCGVAPNAGSLIAGRVVQGLAAGLMTPQVLAILTVSFTGPARAKAFNAYGLAMGFASVFGQLIGGLLIKANLWGTDWRSIFLINVPIGLVALVFAVRVLPETGGSGKSKLDLLGVLLATAGLVGVILPLVVGRERGWPAWTWVCLGAAAVVLVGFVLYQRWLGARGGSPLVDLTMFRQRAFPVGLAATMFFYATMASFFLIFALYLQFGRALSALDSGLIFIPLGVGFFISSMSAKQLTARLGRQTLAVGGVVVAVGLVGLDLLARHVGTTGAIGVIIPALLVSGFGMGMVLAPLSATVLAAIAPHYAASAAGVLSTSLQIGNALGVAIIGNIFYNALGATPVPASFVHGFTLCLIVLVVLAVAVSVTVQFLPRPAKRAG